MLFRQTELVDTPFTVIESHIQWLTYFYGTVWYFDCPRKNSIVKRKHLQHEWAICDNDKE